MENPLDKKLAERLLHAKREGYTFRYFMRLNAKAWWIRGAALAYLGLSAFVIDFHPVLVLTSGILLGSLLRDIAWFRGIRLTWPFSVRVTDWRLVEEIAKGDPASQVTERINPDAALDEREKR